MSPRAQLLPPEGIIDVDVGPYEIPDEEREYAKWREDFGDEESGGRIKVYLLPEGRENKKNSRNIFLFGAALDEYDYEGLCGKLVREFGTGIYRVIGITSSQRGSKFNKLIEVRAPFKTDEKPEQSNKPESVSSMLSAVASIVESSQERTEKLMAGLLGDRAPQDPMQNLISLMNALGQLKGFMGGGEKTSFIGELESHAKIAEMLGTLGGGDEKGANTNDIWLEMVKLLGPTILQGAMSTGPMSGVVQALPAPMTKGNVQPPESIPAVVTAPAPNPKEKMQAEKDEKMNALKIQCIMLEKFAKAKTTAADMAERILDSTPDNKLTDLYEFISSETCIQTMIAAHPPLQAYQDWLTELRNLIISELVPEDEMDAAGSLGFNVPPAAELAGEGMPIGVESSGETVTLPDTPDDTALQRSPKAKKAKKARPRKKAKKAKRVTAPDAGIGPKKNDGDATSDT